MANKKTNKFAQKDVVREVKEAPAQEKIEEKAKPAEAAPAAETKPAVTEAKASAAETVMEAPKAAEEAKPEKPAKAPAKKAEAKTAVSEKLVIEFVGANYESGDVLNKCREAFAAENPNEKLASIEVYINVCERRAYYVANGKAESKYIEL